jgi:hypothetical protein
MSRVADDVAGDSYRRGLDGGHRSSQNSLGSCLRSYVLVKRHVQASA